MLAFPLTICFGPGLVLAVLAAVGTQAAHSGSATPALQCAATPRDCVSLMLDAMGGRERLQAIRSLGLEGIQHTQLVEQSYRQRSPFITAYARTKEENRLCRTTAYCCRHI